MRRAWMLLLMAVGMSPAATIAYQYDASGRLVSATYDSGTVVTYTYDNAGNLLSRSVSAPAAPQAATMAQVASGTVESAEAKPASNKVKDAGGRPGRKSLSREH